MEIEKKFLVKELPQDLACFKKKEIEQGYLCTNPVVRIRRSDDEYYLTYKSKAGIEKKMQLEACVNQEVEVPLTKGGYEHLRSKIDHYAIRKTRYLIPLQVGLTAELDIFKGRLKGLIFAEVEFPDIKAAGDFIKPGWMGEEVSLDKRYSNSYLSSLGSFEEWQANPSNVT